MLILQDFLIHHTHHLGSLKNKATKARFLPKIQNECNPLFAQSSTKNAEACSKIEMGNSLAIQDNATDKNPRTILAMSMSKSITENDHHQHKGISREYLFLLNIAIISGFCRFPEAILSWWHGCYFCHCSIQKYVHCLPHAKFPRK